VAIPWKFFGEIFDIDIYPLVSVIIFYFLRFPLNIPLPSTRKSSSFTTNPLSPFDYDPFNVPDTRYPLRRIGFRWRIHRPSIQANKKKFSTSILPLFTVLFTGKVQFGK
jgi:hypothetical protein